jgi:dTDP-D-glucose 4,6-dehydratase
MTAIPLMPTRIGENAPVSDLRLRRLLVTGGAGFIGSAFVVAGEADAIVNFAAESHVDRSLMNAGTFVQTDVYGTYVLLEAARKYRHQRFLQVSTDEVYGHVKAGRSKETDPLAPRSPYSATKVGAEMLVGAYHASYNLPTLITRGANTYGPYQFPEKIVPLFITNALQDLPLPIYGDGSAVRDYLYVDDHVSAIARILWKGEPGSAYNIGTGSEVSGVDVADLVLQLCKKPRSLKHFVKDRSRLSLRARHASHQAARVGGADEVRRGDEADGRLVLQERWLVAAAENRRVLGFLPAQLQGLRGERHSDRVKIVLTGVGEPEGLEVQ